MKEHVQNLITPVNSNLRTVLEVINQGALGVAFLVDQETQKFAALVTDGDVRRALLKGFSFEDSISHAIPRKEPVTALSSMPFNEILKLFSQTVRIIPVLDDAGRIVDIAVFDKRRFFPVAEPVIGEKEWEYVSDCVLSGWVSSVGQFVNRFEALFAEFCETKHAISTSNGTSALHLALLACGVGPGDEVIVPTLTFIATANAVVYTGATPVFVDSELPSWNMDVTKIEAAITKRTKAIIPVHLYGHPVDMEPVLDLARRYNLKVIEDAAEAHGATYKGQKVGSMGNLGIFSFFGNKIVTTGEGGMVVTDNDEYADKIRILRDHGMDKQKRYWHTVLGFNYRMTNMQAALGVAQMEKIDSILLKKRQNAMAYTEELAGVPGITVPEEGMWTRCVCWLYSILVDGEGFGMSRNELMDALQDRGIETRPVFYPVHSQPVYARKETLPVAEYISEHGVSLPSSARLEKKNIIQVARAIKELAVSRG